ncbi:MAG: hypothetical protein ACFFDT_16600 [Candidatus Hodarchaeota archaeon]
MANDFGDEVAKHGWNDIEKSIMWIWWEFIDPMIGYSIFGYEKDDPQMHYYLSWVTKMAITVTLPLFMLILILFVLFIRARKNSGFIVPSSTETTGETMDVEQYGPITREDKVEVLIVLREATTSAIKYLEKRYKRKKLTEPAYQKTLRTLTLQIQKIDNTIKKTEGAALRDLFGDSSGVSDEEAE